MQSGGELIALNAARQTVTIKKCSTKLIDSAIICISVKHLDFRRLNNDSFINSFVPDNGYCFGDEAFKFIICAPLRRGFLFARSVRRCAHRRGLHEKSRERRRSRHEFENNSQFLVKAHKVGVTSHQSYSHHIQPNFAKLYKSYMICSMSAVLKVVKIKCKISKKKNKNWSKAESC